MPRSLIVAMSKNGVIGRAGDLPWRLSADLKRFKQLTMGHHVIMGRKTYESIGRPLPGRTLIVVTRQTNFVREGVLIAHDLPAAWSLAAEDDEPFIIGGAEIYRQALPQVERLYVTWVDAEIAGDTHFPHVDWNAWALKNAEPHSADDRNEYNFSFRIYERN